MTTIYETEFTKIGDLAVESLNENMLITFKQGAPADVEEYCFMHNPKELTATLQVGDIAEFDGVDYPITALGDVASTNLKELGHVTFRFDSAAAAEYPGTIHVKGTTPTSLKVGSVLKIKRS
ncbi:PTS glucitol/sorbitol transporter subunit IIA [Pasteurellaceae bacterium 22721_9_1]